MYDGIDSSKGYHLHGSSGRAESRLKKTMEPVNETKIGVVCCDGAGAASESDSTALSPQHAPVNRIPVIFPSLKHGLDIIISYRLKLTSCSCTSPG